MPSVEDVCTAFDITDVPIEYTDADYDNLTTYKLFQQHVRPTLQKENQKVPQPKLMMLVAAKWREFCEKNPHLQSPEEDKKEEEVKQSRSSSKTEKVRHTTAKYIHIISNPILGGLDLRGAHFYFTLIIFSRLMIFLMRKTKMKTKTLNQNPSHDVNGENKVTVEKSPLVNKQRSLH